MCTVSWSHQPGGYHLLCNRDEQRTRRAGRGPAIVEHCGGRYVAPADGDFGGTWIAVNDCGVGLCLLNGDAVTRAAGSRSRGFVIPELIGAHSADDCEFLVRQLDLTAFAAFSLVILEPGRRASIAAWDGRRLVLRRAAATGGMLTSSSFDPVGVRRARWRARACHPELYRFHTSHGDAPSAYSPCMHRSDAETVSFSWVVVNQSEVRFLYLPAAPCQCQPGEQRILSRAA